MEIEVKAFLKYLRISPRKARLVTDSVKGLKTEQAVKNLAFTPKRTALPLLKLLKSAINNAKTNFRLDPANLYIKEIKVDEGPVLKRHMPRARGRATIIRKRTSHISLILGETKLKK